MKTEQIHQISQRIKSLSRSFDFNKIPDSEKSAPWFITLFPIVRNRINRPDPHMSPLIQVLFDTTRFNWIYLKKCLERAQECIENWQQIFGISARVKTSDNPDLVIDVAISEIRCAIYLHLRRFAKITHSKTSIDFAAEYAGEKWNIEATFLSGPDFKEQKVIEGAVVVEEFSEKGLDSSPVFQIDSKRFILKLKNKFMEERQQLVDKGIDLKRSIIVILCAREETYEPWFAHEGDNHPILDFIETCDVPTVIIGNGTIYEPDAEFVKGKFPIEEF